MNTDNLLATAVIQARMSSTRFAGKILHPIWGKPLLWHIIHRLKNTPRVNKIVVATSIEPTDDAVEEFAASVRIPCVRGSLNNVLERFSFAVEQFPNRYIVRICGDSPLIDPFMINEHLESLAREDGDYAVVDDLENCIHEGFEVFSHRLLLRIENELYDDPIAMEHVTGYVKFHPEFCRVIVHKLREEHYVPGSRTSVDTPADLEFIEKLYELTGASVGDLDMDRAVQLIRAQPELLEVNRHVRQKTGDEPTRRVCIRCDADKQKGFGNLSRCMTLAKAFREYLSWGVTFASASSAVIEKARSEKYGVIELDVDDPVGSFSHALEASRPDAVVLDLSDATSRADVDTWHNSTQLITVIDDRSERRLAADLAFYPPAPELNDLNWSDSNAEVLSGWDWIILGGTFRRFGKSKYQSTHPAKVLLTLGGSVPSGMACRLVKIIGGLEMKFDIEVVVADGFEGKEHFQNVMEQALPGSGLSVNVPDLADRMVESDLVICAFGVTSYEAVAEGCATLIIPRNHNNALSAFALEDAGAARALDENDKLSDDMIADEISKLIGSGEEREKIRRRPGELIDHSGGMRIAQHIRKKLDEILQKGLDERSVI